MYLIINEEFESVLVHKFTKNDIKAADEEVIELIDISKADNPKYYFDGEWHEFAIRIINNER